MNRLKQWLCNKFLPAYAKEAYLEEIEKQQNTITALRAQNKQLEAYCKGLEMHFKHLRKIRIISEVKHIGADTSIKDDE